MTILFKNCSCKHMYCEKYCIMNFQETLQFYVSKKEHRYDSNNGYGKHPAGDGRLKATKIEIISMSNSISHTVGFCTHCAQSTRTNSAVCRSRLIRFLPPAIWELL